MSPDKTIFVSGQFNILHPGHVRLLRFARELGDRLVVGVQSDRMAGSNAHVAEELRLEGVRSNIFVSEAFLLDEPVEDVIARLHPDCVVKGREYEHRLNPEAQAVAGYGGELVFSSGEALFSSLDLIRMDLGNRTGHLKHESEEYFGRHSLDVGRIVGILEEIRAIRVCVIGDLIVDEYVVCDPLGMSQEDPTLVVAPVDSQCFLGGAGIVAAHAASLGGQARLLSVVGEDDMREFAESELRGAGVRADLSTDTTRPTTRKQRFRAEGKTLLRVNHVHQAWVNATIQDLMLDRYRQIVEECDLVIFSDFNYGCLPQGLVDTMSDWSSKAGMMMAADSQSSSQIGDVCRFAGMDLLTPTEHEARVSLRNSQDGLVVLAEDLRRRSGAKNIIMKLGSEGALLHMAESAEVAMTDRIPALNLSPVDVAGAGDSLLVGSSMALAAGASTWEAAYIGTIAAAAQVDRVGNVPLSREDLTNWIA